MLTTAVGSLHQMQAIIATVEELGRRHVAYGVTPEHYEPVGAALLWTLEQGLGSEFTSPIREAWTEAYTILSDAMKHAAAANAVALQAALAA